MPEGIGYGKKASKKLGVSIKELSKMKRNKTSQRSLAFMAGRKPKKFIGESE